MAISMTTVGWRSFPLGAVLGVALLGSRALGLGAERFNVPATLKNLGYEAVELRRTDNNKLFLFGKVEGRQRSCLVDTGWSHTTVSTNTAARLAQTNLIRQLQLGSVLLTDETVLSQDLRVNGQPTSYDVVLGCDFLRRHHAVLDCVSRRLYLRDKELTTAERAVLEQALKNTGGTVTAMKLREPLALTCEARVENRAVELLVDSGAMWSCLDAKVAANLNLRARPTLNRIMGPGAMGQRSFAVAELKAWQLGDQQMRETSVAVFSLAEWGLGPDGKLFRDIGGILGGAELFKARAIIDCSGLKLWLRPER